MGWGAKVFIERLRLRGRRGRVSVTCPFHVDSQPSLSVDLDRDVFYCHGGCSEPKGGGPVEFVIKWAAIKEGKTLTWNDARRQVERGIKVVDAATLRRELMIEALELFAESRVGHYANACRALDNMIQSVSSRANVEWDALALLYEERSWYEWAFAICVATDARHLPPELPLVYRTAKLRDEWTFADEHAARALREQRDRARALAGVHVIERKASEASCRESLSTSSVTRVPIPRRQPVPRL